MNLIELEQRVDKCDLKKVLPSLRVVNELNQIQQERGRILNDLFSAFREFKSEDLAKTKVVDLVDHFFLSYFDLNPFEVEIDSLGPSFSGMKKQEMSILKNFLEYDQQFKMIYEKLGSIDYDSMIKGYLNKIAEIENEYIYTLPITNMFNFLLDFSEIIPTTLRINGSTKDEYTLKTAWGPFNFKILEKENNKKIVYQYIIDGFYWGENGRFYIEFEDITPGKVKIKTKNIIDEIDEKSRENLQVINYLGVYLKTYIDLFIGKVVASHVHSIFYERKLDDMSVGNYRILQTKINEMGKKIEDLKDKFYEVKASPLLSSFDCSECGASLEITSKEEKFVICEHCDTTFLIEWQKIT